MLHPGDKASLAWPLPQSPQTEDTSPSCVQPGEAPTRAGTRAASPERGAQMGPHAGGAVPGPPGAAPGCHVVAASAGFQGPPCWASLWLSSLPACVPGARAPDAPVPHLHLLRRQQIFIEHVRLAPETQQGGEGGPGGVPALSSCSRGGGRNENQHRSRETERSAARLGPNSAPGRAQSGCRGQGTPEDRAPHRTQTREARRGRGWGKPPCRGERSRLL